MRFIRGCNHNIDETIKSIILFLKWRQDNNVDEIRQDIVYRGINTPFMFPFGKIIIKLAPQIVITANSLDYKGQPLGIKIMIVMLMMEMMMMMMVMIMMMVMMMTTMVMMMMMINTPTLCDTIYTYYLYL